MPEFRQDLISGQWVIIATERARRPETFACKGKEKEVGEAGPGTSYLDNCPFCPGNEEMTPAPVLVLGESLDSEPLQAYEWRVRVIPNKYPALEPEAMKNSSEKHWLGGETCGELFKTVQGYGVHEVIVETPRHNLHPGALPLKQMKLMVEAYFRRYEQLTEMDGIRYIQLFRNHRREAGASIEHPHSQLLALPFIPEYVQLELERAHRFYLQEENCPYCLLLEEERSLNFRVVTENKSFTALMPFASRYPFETWVLPRRHQSSFLEMSMQERCDLAALLGDLLRQFELALNSPPYNYYLHGSPGRAAEMPHYHWHLELIPKLTTTAGFEMGSGIHINVTLPEEAATFVRNKGGLPKDEAKPHDLFCYGSAQSPTCRQPK